MTIAVRFRPVEPRGFEPLTSALQRRIMRGLYLRRWRDRTVDLRNNIQSNSLRLPWFVPKCAQNVPTMCSREASASAVKDRLGTSPRFGSFT